MLRVLACTVLFLLLSGPAVAGPVTLLSKADPDRPSATAGGFKEAVGISSDGRYVLLSSDTDNLLDGVADSNAGEDLFLHDRVAGTTVLVSHAAGGPSATGNAPVLEAAFSADGRWVAFRSAASDLVASQVDQPPSSGSQSAPDIFLWDRDSGLTRLVSHQEGLPTTAAGWCWVLEELRISSDGSRVAFVSGGNLVAGLSGDLLFNVYVHDRAAGTNTLVSRASSSATVARGGTNVALSANGGWVAFVSGGTDLAAGQIDANGAGDLFLYGVVTGTNLLVSHAAGSAVTTGNTGYATFDIEPQISADGSRIAYVSRATDLVAGQSDTNNADDLFLYDRGSGTNILVSHTSAAATTAGSSGSQDPVLSADGRHVAFASGASDLVTGDTSTWLDVFAFDRDTGANTLVSRGDAPADNSSFLPRISADGAWIGFSSLATNLAAGQADRPGTADVFLWSRASGSVSLISRTAGSATAAAAGDSGGLRLSADASWIALFSNAEKLVDGVDDWNATYDIFLYERASGENHLITLREGPVSATAGGRIAHRSRTVMSNDGRYVAFTSEAPNLIPGGTDENNQADVFLVDRAAGTTRLVSHASGSPAAAGNAASHDPLVSADGTVVVFESGATDLVPDLGVTFPEQLYLHVRASGQSTLITHEPHSLSSGASGGTEDGQVAVSGDGRWVAFAYSGILIDDQVDNNIYADIFLFDRATGTNTLVSHSSFSPVQTGNGPSTAPSISADGRYIAFASLASDLAPGQAGPGGIFLHDRITGTTTRVSASGTSPLAISADGRQVVFTSTATDVVPGQVDTNSAADVFLWDRVSGATLLVSHTPGSPVTAGNARSNLGTFAMNPPVLSADGRWTAFSSNATDLVSGQTGGTGGLFLFDRVTGTVTLVSRSAASPTMVRSAQEPAVSADGRFVVFASSGSDLVPGQANPGGTSCFLYDRVAGTVSLVSHLPASEVAAASCADAARVSADGAWVAFHSPAPDLVAGDHDGTVDAFLHANLLPGRDLYTVAPCRLLDTRQAGQGPILASGQKRSLAVPGSCGIPDTARAVVVNVTVVQPSANGYLVLHAGDLAPDGTSTVNFGPGQVRSNNAIVSLALDGGGTLAASPVVAGGGTVHLIVDVSGYFD